jgi:hypothetical protein
VQFYLYFLLKFVIPFIVEHITSSLYPLYIGIKLSYIYLVSVYEISYFFLQIFYKLLHLFLFQIFIILKKHNWCSSTVYWLHFDNHNSDAKINVIIVHCHTQTCITYGGIKIILCLKSYVLQLVQFFTPDYLFIYLLWRKTEKYVQAECWRDNKKLLPNICNMYFIYFYKPV